MIDEKQFSDIVAASAGYKYRSLHEVEIDDFTNCEIISMDDNIILLIDRSKNSLHVYWATNSLECFIEELQKLNDSVFISFVPEEFVATLENIGFEILCEYIDYFNDDIISTLTGFDEYGGIQFLLPSEVEEVSALSFSCQWQSRGFRGETALWFEKWIAENSVIVVKVDDNIIGYCCVSIYANGTILWIHEIAVHPDYQGQGYGRLLIEQAICYGRNGGAKRGFLAADILNVNAVGLYNKYGFSARNDESEIQMIN